MDKLQGFRSSPSSANIVVPALDFICKVEAKYPALLFKQQAAAHSIFGENILLSNCTAMLELNLWCLLKNC